MGNRPALSGVFALRFYGERAAAEHIQAPLGIGLLVELTLFCRGRNGIEDTGVCNAGFGVVRDELITIGGNPDARKARSSGHNHLRDASPMEVSVLGLFGDKNSSPGVSPLATRIGRSHPTDSPGHWPHILREHPAQSHRRASGFLLTPLSKVPRHYAEAPRFPFSHRGTSDKVLALYGQMTEKYS